MPKIHNFRLSKLYEGLTLLSAPAAYLSFTLMDSVIKIVSSNSANSPIVVLFILNLSAFIYYCILFRFLKLKPLTKNYKFHVIRGTINIFAASAILYSFTHLSLTQVYVIVFVAPFLNTLFGMVFLKDDVSFGSWVSILLGFAGIVTAFRPWNDPLTVDHGIAFMGAIMLSASFLMLKQYGKDEKPCTIAFYSSSMLTVFYGILTLFYYTPLLLPDILLICAAGMLMSFSALMVTYGVMRFGFATMGVFQYTQLIWGGIASYLFFDEIPTVFFYIGAGLVILGGVVNSANRIFRSKWL